MKEYLRIRLNGESSFKQLDKVIYHTRIHFLVNVKGVAYTCFDKGEF
jgi:hypothetical protein